MSYSNPYQSPYGQPAPYGQYGGPPPVDPIKVNAPAIGLIAVGGFNLLQSMYALGRNLLGMNENAPPPRNLEQNPALKDFYENFKVAGALVRHRHYPGRSDDAEAENVSALCHGVHPRGHPLPQLPGLLPDRRRSGDLGPRHPDVGGCEAEL
jgi:hypothetical protein